MNSRELEIGRAAEHLVIADLILAGYHAFMTEQGFNYDVVLDHNSEHANRKWGNIDQLPIKKALEFFVETC